MKKILLCLFLSFPFVLSQEVVNSTVLHFVEEVSVTVRGHYIHAENAEIDLELETALNIEGSITNNGGNVSGTGEVYLNNVDVYGCTDSSFEDYDENAVFDDGSCGFLGDVNFDSIINIQDVILTVNITLETMIPTPEEFAAADMTGDGIVNILDVIMIVNVVMSE